MLWTIIIILIILCLFGFLGPNVIPGIPHFGPWVHGLIVIVVTLIMLPVFQPLIGIY
jgi:hypothetical protein